MLYVHENNLNHKIASNYRGKGEIISKFKEDVYMPMRNRMMELEFNEGHRESFYIAAELCNNYYSKIEEFSEVNDIASQSKFASTFLEEISVYLFKDLPAIRHGKFEIFNKGIYAGMKINNEENVSTIKKDVDFCIGKKINISIDDAYEENIIIPVVAVEVKTYLDATMFGEIKSSSKSIKSATPNSKTYVLMGYKDLADNHIIAARQDATLNEMFALRRSKSDQIEHEALYTYWKEIADTVNSLNENSSINSLGKLLYPDR